MAQTRDQWTSRIGFVLAASGSAVGLGNLWKFPYITWHNDGGAFVLVYLVCILLVGLPIMISEILIGRMTQKSAVGALKAAVGPVWGIVGAWGVLAGFVILGYYTVIAGWALRNFGHCVAWTVKGYPGGEEVGAGFAAFMANGPWQVSMALLFAVATMAVVYRGVGQGIEKTARMLMPVLFVILLVLLGTVMTMSGFGPALRFTFAPRFAELRPSGILEALGHAFFTLSLGMGAMITYGSYLGRRTSVVGAAFVVVVLDTLIAIVATIVMFSVIHSVDGMAAQVTQSTVGMLFITLPDLFYTTVPLGNLLAPAFYALVAFAALTSTISLLEVVSAYFIDERGLSRPRATLLCGGTIVVVTILCALSFGAWKPISEFVVFEGKAGLFATLDHLAANWFLPIGGFLITIAVGWFMTREVTERELVDDETPGWFSYGVWRFFIRYVSPIAVAAIIAAVISGKDFT